MQTTAAEVSLVVAFEDEIGDYTETNLTIWLGEVSQSIFLSSFQTNIYRGTLKCKAQRIRITSNDVEPSYLLSLGKS